MSFRMKSDKHNVTNIINDLNKKVKEEVKEEVKIEVKEEVKVEEKERNMQKLLEDMHKTILILIASNNKHMEFIQEIIKKVAMLEQQILKIENTTLVDDNKTVIEDETVTNTLEDENVPSSTVPSSTVDDSTVEDGTVSSTVDEDKTVVNTSLKKKKRQ